MQTSEPSPLSEKEIFKIAARLPPSERAAWLQSACDGRPEVRAGVEQLLTSLEDEAFMQRAADRTATPEVEAELARLKPEEAGERIGSYTLREQIGAGGFGTVWVADQEKPVRRRVALKIIKLGMDTKEVIARFEQERQALAMMEHPNIAKVLDAGATSFGRPYFIMELVRGIKITTYCDQANVPTAERLRLFIAVCHAVQHAHQKGIIHRDLKPSNILVTLHDGVPVPKVIDFGVAKATQQQRFTDLTIYTQFEQMIGTPLYMSPEQAEMSGLDIDTRSDIYSLGVLLYELLVGHTPFDPETLMKAGFDEMRRVIREQEPQRPSTFVSTLAVDLRTNLAQHRQTDSAKLVGQIRGDLDWIVMKALEKDRGRRYESASTFAQDIQRHLASEPVLARPASVSYRFRRFARRNNIAVGAGAAVAAALVIGLGFSTWSFLREREQHTIADQARAAAEQQRAIANNNAKRAVESENDARRQAYASDMILTQQALDAQDLGRARQLLDRHRALGGKEDLRGWEWRYLWQQCLGHKSTILTTSRFSWSINKNYGVASLSLSPDDQRLAVAFTDGQVELWDLSHRKLIKVLQAALLADDKADITDEMQTQVAYSPITETVVASNPAGEVILYDFAQETGSTLCSLDGEIRDLCYSPDGACVAVLYQTLTGGVALVVDATERKVITTVTLPQLGNFLFFDCVRFSPDHRRLYVSFGSSRQPTLRCVSVPGGEILWESQEPFQGPSKKPQYITAMAISPDGKAIATAAGYETGQIHVSDAENGQLFATLEGHTTWVADLVFSKDGGTLVSVSGDQTARFWNTATWESRPPIRAHGAGIVGGVALTANGNMLVTGDLDGFVMLCDPRQRITPSGPISPREEISFTQVLPGAAGVLVRDTQQNYSLMNLATLSERKLPLSPEHSTWFVAPNFIGIQTQRNRFELFQIAETGTKLIAATAITPLPSSSIAYCAERRLLAWTEDSTTIHVTNVDHASEQGALECEEPSDPIAISADGSLLQAMNKKRIARVWDMRDKRRIAAAEQYFSPFGLPLMDDVPNAYGLENMPHSWLLEWLNNASLRPKLGTGAAGVAAAPAGFWPSGHFGNRAFSPDGCTFAVSTATGRIALYDARGPTLLAKFEGRRKAIYSIAFSPDGARLFAPNSGLWDIKSKQQVLVLPANVNNLYHAEWTEDGNTLLAGRRDISGCFQVWRAPSWEQIEETERNGGGWRHPSE